MSAAHFLSEELEVLSAEADRHGCGSRVLCRLLEHHWGDAGSSGAAARLTTDELDNAASLCFHASVQHVVACSIEHGSIKQQHNTALTLRGHLVCLLNSFWNLCSAKLFCCFVLLGVNPLLREPSCPALGTLLFRSGTRLSHCFVNTLPQDLLGHAAQNIISASSPHANCKKARLVFELLVFALSPTGVQKVFGPSPLSISSFFERAAARGMPHGQSGQQLGAPV